MSAEDAGTISAQIRLELTQMEKDSLDAQKAMDDLAGKMKVKGELAGKGFADGAKTGWDRSVGKIEASMASLGPLGAKVGTKIATGLSKPVFAVVPKMALAFRSLQAAMGPIMIVVGLVTSAVMAIKGFVDKQNQAAKEAKEKQEALNKQLKEAETNYKNITSSLSDMGMATAGINQNISHQVKLVGNSAEAQEKQAKNQEKYNLILNQTGEQLGELAKKYQLMTTRSINLTASGVYRNEIIEKEAQALRKAGEQEKANILYKEIAVGLESEKLGYLDQVVQALQSQYDRYLLIENIDQKTLDDTKLNLTNTLQAAEYQREKVKQRQEELAVLVKNRTTEENIEAAREKAIEKYELAIRKANDAYTAGLIDKIELKKQEEAALAAEYADIEAIVAQYKLMDGEVVELSKSLAQEVKLNQDIAKAKKYQEEIDATLLDQQDEMKKQLIASKNAMAQSAKTEEEKNKLLDEAIDLENELIALQRQRAWEAIEQSGAYIAASNEEKDEILNNFNAITDGMMKSREKSLKEGGDNWLANTMGISDEKLGKMMSTGESMISAFDNISNAMLEVNRQHAEEQIAIIEKALENTLASIEKARQAELIAAGFAVENNAESLEAQLEAAKRTGDEVLIYQTERRLEEQRINDRFDEEAKAATEQAAKEKAAIEFKLAKEKYATDMINAVNAGIMAVLQALAAAPPPYNFVLAGLSGAATAVQIGLLAANPPKPPKFANSGIVPGNKYSGDRVNALVDSGELILNRAHQDNIANQLTNSSTPVTATIVIMMDSREIAQSTVNLVNNGQYTIKARALE
jgi:hypothetical protein